MRQFLDFEKSVAELENKIYELQRVETATEINIAEELQTLTEKAEKQLRVIYNKLTPWQKVQVSRHAQRPHALDYIKGMIENFMPLAGDRLYAEDHAIIGGLGRFKGQSVVVIGIERGSDLDTRLKHNFGMARPEGYRKAQRLIKLAGQFNLPIMRNNMVRLRPLQNQLRHALGQQLPLSPLSLVKVDREGQLLWQRLTKF